MPTPTTRELPKPPPMPIVRAVTGASSLLDRLKRAITPPPLALVERTSQSHIVSNAILCVTELGVADALREGPLPIAELAERVGAHRDLLYRLMRALSSVGIFQERNAEFALTPVSRCLLSDAPHTLNALLLLACQPWHHRLWSELTETIRSGTPAHERVLGMPLFEYFERNPDASEIFDRAMLEYSAQTSAALLDVYDLGAARSLVDIGGGSGQLVGAALARYPALRGIVFDRPNVAAGARARLTPDALGERVQVVAGDFFQEAPSGGDVYVLMNILHDWDDRAALEILRSVARAMSRESKLLIAEMLVGENGSFPALFDLEMLVLFGHARERTRAEFRALLESAGLELTRVLPTPSPAHLLEARPSSR